MRQLAWLRASPPAIKKDDTRKSRIKDRQDRGIEIQMPELPVFAYLVEWLEECGTLGHGVAGAVPLSFTEIQAWINLSGRNPTNWEAMMIARLSSQYCSQHHMSEDKECNPPYVTELSESDMIEIRRRADAKIRALFG